MKTKKLIYLLMAFSIFAFTIVSCEKEDGNSPVISTVEDDAISDLVFEDIFAEVDAAIDLMEGILAGGIKKSGSVVTCKTITVEHPDDSTFWPRTITVDYGEGCTGPNGVVRKGKIIITVSSGKFWLKGHTRTVTFEDFFVDGLKAEGTKVLTNEGSNESGNIYFLEVLTGGKVITPEGKEITREFERNREWVAGSNTPRIRIDDEYMITGSAMGIDRKERAYSRTITAPLHIKLTCRWIVSGTILFQTEGMPDAILDYGDGECDRKATVTVNEVTKDIILRR